MLNITTRAYSRDILDTLIRGGMHPILARILAARGVVDARQTESCLAGLLRFDSLARATEMASILADAIAAKKRLLVIADYDCDGATACAVAVRALRSFGAVVDYLVPNRFEFGYGLTPELARVAAGRRPDVLITVDNGIASVEGIEEAGRLGLQVLVTDHHLPGDALPRAACIVNPNQPECGFPSKSLAGVGVIFYVMLALRAELRRRGAFTPLSKGVASQVERGDFESLPLSQKLTHEPNLAKLLDLVALGTVADVVRLDDNNRILVRHGLQRIRSGRAQPGIRALFRCSGRDMARASSDDLGFLIGPRLNAAGRLTDMSLGIECLLSDDEDRALAIAAELDQLNQERREIEGEMQDQAIALAERIQVDDSATLTLFDPSWHQGVIGLVASRLRERFYRPVIAFARGGNGELKGSGRSIPRLHLRDALDLVAKRYPGVIMRFGGHAMAAGLSLREANLPDFCEAFEAT
ncbi:MAG TPA: single-stranded-DNA-specific exonuclease RecJ, partial [Burkholderiales bacterium]|nr:single-stranded-DNA-specific exonuclease RecJ [Burkholderiales bacterium]